MQKVFQLRDDVDRQYILKQKEEEDSPFFILM